MGDKSKGKQRRVITFEHKIHHHDLLYITIPNNSKLSVQELHLFNIGGFVLKIDNQTVINGWQPFFHKANCLDLVYNPTY